MRFLPLAAFLGLSILWGSGWLIAASLPAQPRLCGLAIQYGVCALLLLPAIARRKRRSRKPIVIIKTMIAGLGILCVPQVLILLSSDRLPQSAALAALAMTPVMLAVAGRLAIPTSICGFAGVLFLSSAGLTFSTAQLPWLVLPLAGAGVLAWSLQTAEKQLQEISVVESLFASALVSALLLSACSSLVEHEPLIWSARAVIGFLISGIFTTACGYLLLYWLLGKSGAGQVSMLQWTQVLIAAAEWAILMRLPPDWTVFAGAILIVLALVFAFSNRDEGKGVLFEITQS